VDRRGVGVRVEPVVASGVQTFAPAPTGAPVQKPLIGMPRPRDRVVPLPPPSASDRHFQKVAVPPPGSRLRITGSMLGESVNTTGGAFAAEDAAAARRLEAAFADAKNEIEPKRFCEECFGPRKAGQRYCSEKCRQRAARRIE
jgi:hypothetical protein